MFEKPASHDPLLIRLPLFIIVGKLSLEANGTAPAIVIQRRPIRSLFGRDSNIELGHPIVIVRAVGCLSRSFAHCGCRL